MIKILSNGSRWAGEEPDSIENLLEVLREHPLDRSFEHYGNFVDTSPLWGPDGTSPNPYPDNPGVVVYSGNFSNLSHGFNIHTDEPEVIALLTDAIRANQQRPDYLSQTDWEADCRCSNCRTLRQAEARKAQEQAHLRFLEMLLAYMRGEETMGVVNMYEVAAIKAGVHRDTIEENWEAYRRQYRT